MTSLLMIKSFVRRPCFGAMFSRLPLFRKSHFCRRRTAAARHGITGGGGCRPSGAARRRHRAGKRGREGEAPHGAAKGGTGQGKRHGGTGRAWITSGGRRTARAANRPSFDQAGRQGAERGKGKGGRQAARKGKGRGLFRAVARVSTREKKNPACGGACKGGACAGFIHRRRIATFPRYRKTAQAG